MQNKVKPSRQLKKLLDNELESLLSANKPELRGAVLCFLDLSPKVFVSRDQVCQSTTPSDIKEAHLGLIDTYKPEAGEIVVIFCHGDDTGLVESIILGSPK